MPSFFPLFLFFFSKATAGETERRSATQSYKVVAVDVEQSSLDLVNSYRWKPDVGVLATEPAKDAVSKITADVQGTYPSVDAAILATDAPPAFDFAADVTKKHGRLILVG